MIVTSLAAARSLLMLCQVHDFPDEAKFLSDDDRRRVIRRLKLDKQSSAEHEEFKLEYFYAAIKDWKTLTGALVYMGCDGALYAFSLFLPTIIQQMGYKNVHAQLLSVPPYAVAAVATVTVGFIADRTGKRGMSCLQRYDLDLRVANDPRLLQHGHVVLRHSRLRHAARVRHSTRSVRRHFSRRDGDLSVYSEYHQLDSKQCRGCLQARYCPRLRDWLGKS
jgi:hypothetical protein